MEKPEKDLIAWMPDIAEDGQQMLAMWIVKGTKLTKEKAINMWLWTIQQHLNQQEDKEDALEYLQYTLEDMGLKMLFLDARSPETAIYDMINPFVNPRVGDLIGAWCLSDLVPNEEVNETNPEAEEILLNHDWGSMVESIRYP